MILHLYFARKYLSIFTMILGGFTIFIWLVELLEHIRRYDAGEMGFLRLSYLAALHLPEVLYQVLTLVVLLSTITMFITLARTSELVITRATGRSALRSLASPAITAFVLGCLVVSLANPLVALSSKAYERAIDGDGGRVLSVSKEGLWLRQGVDDNQTAIRAARTNLDGTVLYDTDFYGFDPEGTPIFRIQAAEAALTPDGWQLSQAKIWDLAQDEIPEAGARQLDSYLLPSELTPDQIRDSFGTPSSISIWALPAFISQLENAGFSARTHMVWLQAELARPLSFVAMVFIGAVFTLRHTRMGRTGLMVLLAVLSGFLVYFIANLTQLMGQNGQIPVPFAVWSPSIAAICLALAALLHFEDG
ncbi:LPS export ABC transporter permease LptG [Mangrovicoccus algicola]|uniref:LPS export ABC transporter permease LptG n=1 Tax=Mangrovicoccus algicola TaxID=2771008 RepID=A0A8J7CZE5_9RHOB|nr:LPS export ABC transporter permease LptG [Mangrovicoccus algicola]MBE3637768.1 LPS export ABC transporter permease LptG [Mangrovicoccus algicola]